jgi:hypothetical protein
VRLLVVPVELLLLLNLGSRFMLGGGCETPGCYCSKYSVE